MPKPIVARLCVTLAALALAACAESATAPSTPNLVAGLASRSPSLAVSGGPDLSDFRTFQGEVWICKDGSGPATSFAIDYSVVRQSDNSLIAAGSVSVPLGQCVLAATINTEQSGRYLATATEQAPPANWALTAIDWAYGLNLPLTPPPPTVDLPNRTISAVLVANDVGVQLTFTNTHTPPGPSCTLTQGFWKNHTELWDATGEKIVTTSDLFFNSGKSYITLMKTPPAGGNSYLQLAHQYIAAKLNLNGGSDPTIDAAITQAEAIFNSFAAGVWTSKNKTLTSLASTLDNYNNGVTGPGHCN